MPPPREEHVGRAAPQRIDLETQLVEEGPRHRQGSTHPPADAPAGCRLPRSARARSRAGSSRLQASGWDRSSSRVCHRGIEDVREPAGQRARGPCLKTIAVPDPGNRRELLRQIGECLRNIVNPCVKRILLVEREHPRGQRRMAEHLDDAARPVIEGDNRPAGESAREIPCSGCNGVRCCRGATVRRRASARSAHRGSRVARWPLGDDVVDPSLAGGLGARVPGPRPSGLMAGGGRRRKVAAVASRRRARAADGRVEACHKAKHDKTIVSRHSNGSDLKISSSARRAPRWRACRASMSTRRL